VLDLGEEPKRPLVLAQPLIELREIEAQPVAPTRGVGLLEIRQGFLGLAVRAQRAGQAGQEPFVLEAAVEGPSLVGDRLGVVLPLHEQVRVFSLDGGVAVEGRQDALELAVRLLEVSRASEGARQGEAGFGI
jgi:hypothetical protein